VEIPDIGQRVSEVVDIANVQVVDEETARRTVSANTPKDAITVQTLYTELDKRANTEIVVYGTVVKATSAVGAIWVHVQDGTGDPRSKNGVAVFALAVRLFLGGNLVIKSQVELSRGLTLRLCITDLGNFEDGIKVGVLMGLYDALPIRSPIPGGLKSPLVASALGGVGILGSQVASPSHVSEEAVRLLLIQHAGVILPRESFPAGSAFCVQLRQWKAAKSAQGVALMTADDKSLVRIRRRVLKITVVSPAPQVLHDACIILQIRGAPHPGGLLLDDLELIMLLH
jgi:hypothetical protein